MPFSTRSFRPSPVRAGAFVLAVGRRVYVSRSEDGPVRVTLTDDAGTNALATLADGHEVEILAWRPRGSGTRYHVRSTREDLEGWVAVGNLRRLAVAPPISAPSPTVSAPPPPRARESGYSGRRFGQRAH
jgi:hypothetical protein